MINDWEELACIKVPMHKEYNELKIWLRSQTQTSGTTVSATSHPIQMLRSILGAAIHEIRDNLDQQVGMLVVEAQTYHIQVQIEGYYRTRSDDWDAMLPTDIDEMSREECVRLMHAARDEIAWLVSEISRLECYISIEKQMDRHRLTERRPFLRPLARKVRQQEAAPEQDGGEEDVSKSVEQQEAASEQDGGRDVSKNVDSAVESSPRAASMELDMDLD
jgi:hypothetical protein